MSTFPTSTEDAHRRAIAQMEQTAELSRRSRQFGKDAIREARETAGLARDVRLELETRGASEEEISKTRAVWLGEGRRRLAETLEKAAEELKDIPTDDDTPIRLAKEAGWQGCRYSWNLYEPERRPESS